MGFSDPGQRTRTAGLACLMQVLGLMAQVSHVGIVFMLKSKEASPLVLVFQLVLWRRTTTSA